MSDDATLLLHGEYSVRLSKWSWSIYEKCSGSKLNMHKTKGIQMWLGSIKSRPNHRSGRYTMDQW